MDIVRISAQRAGRLFAAFGFLLASILPALVPSLAAAATATERSIALSSSAKDASGVTYSVSFKAPTIGTGAFVVDFCEDSPTIGASCDDTITGFTTAGVGTSGSDTVSSVDANTVKVVLASATSGANEVVTVPLTGIHNPTAAGPLYARIVTYQDGTTNYHYTSATSVGTHLDDGSVAISITDSIGVNGAVLESLLFCVSGADTITSGCASGITAPTVTLGSGGVLGTTLSEGTIYSQISTNAAAGAVVSLKSGALGCGGLVRAGAASNAAGCGITPLTSAGSISDGAAKFGVKLAGLGAGTGTVAASGSYSTTNYLMNYVSGDASGVTSPYGDPIFNTSSLPVNDGTADLTFGANISNVTPAGNYSATLSLIATGKF